MPKKIDKWLNRDLYTVIWRKNCAHLMSSSIINFFTNTFWAVEKSHNKYWRKQDLQLDLMSSSIVLKLSRMRLFHEFFTNLSDSNLVKFSHWIRDRYKVGGAHKVVMGSVCKTSRTLRVSNLGISCTKTPAACDQGAKTLDQADFAQPVSLKIDFWKWWIINGKIYYRGNFRNSI